KSIRCFKVHVLPKDVRLTELLDDPTLLVPWFGVVTSTSRFEATRELFGDGPRHYEPRSPALQTHQRKDV
ncbi:hypothetical protein AVEN_33055-1, partial [Araneus ventricosus]